MMPKRRGFILGRLLVTTCVQAQGAPLVDRGVTFVEDGDRRVETVCVSAPWLLRERWGNRRRTSRPAVALVLGWMSAAG